MYGESLAFIIDERDHIKAQHDDAFFELRHYDSVDRISATALRSMRRVRPSLFEKHSYMEKTYSEGFNGEVEFLSPVVKMNKTRNGFNLSTRPNGFDEPKWI